LLLLGVIVAIVTMIAVVPAIAIVAIFAVALFAPVAIALAAIVLALAVVTTTVLSIAVTLVPGWLMCLLSPFSFGEASVIALLTLTLVPLAFFVALVVLVFTALAVAIRRCLLFIVITCPPAACLLSVDTGAAAASCPPVEFLLPLMALYFIMADCYVLALAPTPSSHCRSCHDCCHCIMIVGCPAALMEESLQKKKRQKSLFLITAKNWKQLSRLELLASPNLELLLTKTKNNHSSHPLWNLCCFMFAICIEPTY
jgi:hypothetical protein